MVCPDRVFCVPAGQPDRVNNKMKYSKVHIDAIGYELGPVVVTTSELEERVLPMLETLHIPRGQLEALTGIRERRWWDPGFPLSEGAALR